MTPNTQIHARRKATRGRRFLIIAAVLLASSPFVAWCAARFLIVKADVKSPDAIVVLSGSSTYVERAAWAAQLYREGRAPLIVLTNDGLISGWDHLEARNPYYYELRTRRLAHQGVAADRIQLASGQALGTYEETLLVRDHSTGHHFKPVLIATSRYPYR